MRPLERVPAVRRIETDRTDAFAIEITGEFNSADAENLCGLLEGAYALHQRIDLLVRVADLTRMDLTDMSPETSAFMRDHVAEHVGKCAIIDDGEWGREVERLFRPGAAVETRHFTTQDEPSAWIFVGAREVGEEI